MKNAVILVGLIATSLIAWGDDIPAADQVTRRIAKANPDPDIQNEAQWTLAIRQVESAGMAAMITTASRPPHPM